jgi:hypothetical protein
MQVNHPSWQLQTDPSPSLSKEPLGTMVPDPIHMHDFGGSWTMGGFGGFRGFANAAGASPRSVARVTAMPAAMQRLRAMFFLLVSFVSARSKGIGRGEKLKLRHHHKLSHIDGG